MLKSNLVTSVRARANICVVAIALLTGLDAHAAGVWEAEQIVALNAANVRLVDRNQNTLGVVSVEQVRRLIAIRDKLSSIAGVYPKLIITTGDSPNAFATNSTGTDIVAFNTGMLRLLGEDYDALAAVMGHEIGHLAKRHLEDKSSRDSLLGMMGFALGLALDYKISRRTGVGSNVGQNLGTIGATLVSYKFDREQEREADAAGVSWMHAAGYDPAGALRLWQLLPSSSNDFLSDHPTSNERLENIRTQIAGLAPNRQLAAASTAAVKTPDPISSAISNAEFKETLSDSDDPVVLGLKAVRERRFTDAFKFATEAAEKSDPRGQLGLGYLHFYGLGTTRNYAKAAEWFGLAASQGSATANTFLGIMREYGFGFPKDFSQAAAYYRKASDVGFPAGMARYAQLKILGMGVEKDAAGAIELAKKAAIYNDPLANFVIGLAYYRGEGLTQNLVEAKQHFEKASRYGLIAADTRLVEMYVGATTPQEEEFWDRARASGTGAAFEAYLSSYPEGRYSGLAKASIARLLSNSATGLEQTTPTIEKVTGRFSGYITTSLMPGKKLHGVFDVRADGNFDYKGDNGTTITGTLNFPSPLRFAGAGVVQLPKILGFWQMKYPDGQSTSRVQFVGKLDAGVAEGTFSTSYDRGDIYFAGPALKP